MAATELERFLYQFVQRSPPKKTRHTYFFSQRTISAAIPWDAWTVWPQSPPWGCLPCKSWSSQPCLHKKGLAEFRSRTQTHLSQKRRHMDCQTICFLSCKESSKNADAQPKAEWPWRGGIEMLPELTDIPQTRQTTDKAPACRATRAVRLQTSVRLRRILKYCKWNGERAMQFWKRMCYTLPQL